MTRSAERRTLTGRDWLVVLATVVAAVVAALPGFHLLEPWLSRYPAMVISHGLGLVLLAVAFRQWRVRGTVSAADLGRP